MYQPSESSPTSASVDLTALAQNVAHVRRLAPRADVLAVVKANAYGHGAVEMTRALQQLAVRRFGVATVDEGVALRQAGIRDDVVVLGATMPAQFPDVAAHRLTPVLYRADLVQAFAAAVEAGTAPYPIHIKVETGMGRLGVLPRDLPELLSRSELRGPLRLEGLMTHLADADNPDAGQTEEQLARFQQVLNQVQQRGLAIPLIHVANSAGIIKYPTSLHSLVRPGIMLYGYHTLANDMQGPELQPILTWKTTIAHMHTIPPGSSVSYNRTFIASRQTRVAVLPVGYARRLQPVALESWTGTDRRTTSAGDRTGLHGYDDGQRHGRARRPSWTGSNPHRTTGRWADHRSRPRRLATDHSLRDSLRHRSPSTASISPTCCFGR
ncbi:MAG: alanine racemase [Nitrospira sp.]